MANSQATPSTAPPTCLVTGTGGFLGARLAAWLAAHGWRVVSMTRQPGARAAAVRFQLGEPVNPAALKGADALVHCAYDFNARTWPEIHRTNVLGTDHLFAAAREARVGRMVYVSSVSAFPGCHSLYGRAKLEAEAMASRYGATVLRPGLIYGEPPGGMFGRLVRQVEQSRVLPLFGGGRQVQYLVHEQDLCATIGRFVAGELEAGSEPLTLANETPWIFRTLLEAMARAKGRRVRFVSVPWRLMWAGFKAAEFCGVRLRFRSDSLVSLMHQHPQPSFALRRKLGIECRPFTMEPENARP